MINNGLSDNENTEQQDTQTPTALQEFVQAHMETYFTNLEGKPTNSLYDLIMSEVEQPLLRVVLKHTRGNQTRASEILGINRGTLRKKLNIYGLSKLDR